MSSGYQFSVQGPALIVDPEDSYAREAGVRGRHPRPIGPLKYSLVAEMVAGTRHNFSEPLELVIKRNPSGYGLFFDSVRLPDKQVRRIQFANGTYVLRFESDRTQFYQRGEREDLVLPQPRTQSFHIDFKPGYAYPFPGQGTFATKRGPALIQGTIFDAEGRGIPKVTVALNPPPTIQVSTNPVVTRPWPFSEYLTDESGQWLLVVPQAIDYAPTPQPGIPSGSTVTVRFSFPNASSIDLPNIPFAPGQATSLNQAALRGSVVRKDAGPIAGATIEISGEAVRTRSGSDGTWVHYFGLTQANTFVTVTATPPGGQPKQQNQIPVQARKTVWVPTFEF